jgi:ubiquitin-conjugating enzyme E2 Z
MNFARKRILADIKNVKKNDDLEKCGIHVKFNEENIYNAQALILGPSDTPYEKGFYLFDINFPSDYPMEPPKVKFCTLHPNIRFNPNLYTCGKVCLSIINTWNGPSWTSCLTLSSVLVSIQSLLNEIPIRNEPGFERELKDGEISSKYNRIIEYYNLKVATIGMLENPPVMFEYFKDIMAQYFINNAEFFEKYIDSNMKHNNKVFTTKIYSLNEKFNFQNLKERFDKLKFQYSFLADKTEIGKETPYNTLLDKPDIETNESSIKKRQKPDAKASDFDVGYTMVSEHDGNTYIVKMIEPKKKSSQLTKSYKRWFLNNKNN